MNIGLIGIGAVLAFAAMGSALGAGAAGMASVGAWKKCFIQNKTAPFMLVAFVGAPLTQTIYGNILLGTMMRSTADPALLFSAGITGGLAIAMSAVAQGKAAAASCDAYGETGKGFAQYITVVGICETVALFVMAFLFGVV